MFLTTQNIEQILMAFGESILLHQFLFEKSKIYESTESYFWSNVSLLQIYDLANNNKFKFEHVYLHGLLYNNIIT